MIYTRGTWEVDHETGEIVVNGSMILGQIYGADQYPCCEENIDAECKGNANLVAGCPDMYEALKFAMPYIAKMVADNINTAIPPQRALDLINQALSKGEVNR
jgi:hypothetical protein